MTDTQVKSTGYYELAFAMTTVSCVKQKAQEMRWHYQMW